MKILLDKIAKRYQDNWLFRDISYTFESGKKYAVLGANGSGKSTLLRMIAGMQQINSGTLTYILEEKQLPGEQLFRHISYCAPGMDLVEELSLAEFLQFHFTFKKIRQGFTVDSIIGLLDMKSARHKYLHEFSSGMKQRVKLAQAFFSDAAVLLLDEPCSNLDMEGVQLYQHWLERFTMHQLVIVASNDEREYPRIEHILNVKDYHTEGGKSRM